MTRRNHQPHPHRTSEDAFFGHFEAELANDDAAEVSDNNLPEMMPTETTDIEE